MEPVANPTRVLLYNTNITAEKQKGEIANIINGAQKRMSTTCKLLKNNKCEHDVRRANFLAERNIRLVQLRQCWFEDEEEEEEEEGVHLYQEMRSMPERTQLYTRLSSSEQQYFRSNYPKINKRKKEAYYVY